MKKNRLEAFSDGVIAIIITIMVLEMKVPHSAELSDLRSLLPVFSSYVMSFLYISIYWNNHHHLLHAVEKVNGKVLWANAHLLFWLSLIPFATSWMGENDFAEWPVALYGTIILFAAVAYTILVRTLLAHHSKDSILAKSIGSDLKGKISLLIYIVGILLSFINPAFGYILYFVVALIWLIPDSRIEKNISK